VKSIIEVLEIDLIGVILRKLIKNGSFLGLVSVSQQEILSLYNRFCQLDRNSGGFVSADEFMSVPEFAVNPLAQVREMVLSPFGFTRNFSNKELNIV
jgi:Ca2+-binding EF-hand superfamily protein